MDRCRSLAGSLALSAVTALLAAPLPAAAQAAGSAQGGAQPGTPQAGATHIYRISVFRAAAGRTRDLEKLLTTPAPSPGRGAADFGVVFRHRQGHEWDYMTVEHMGEQATIDLRTGPAPQPDSPLSQAVGWHGDSFVAGPPLDEFRKALNLGGAGSSSGASTGVYVISDYMAAAGHRGKMQQVLNEIAGETPGRTVTFAHVEGAPWNFLMITRYDSWQQFAKEQEAPAAQGGGASPDRGLALREHLATHHDTLATVQAVLGQAR